MATTGIHRSTPDRWPNWQAYAMVLLVVGSFLIGYAVGGSY